MKNPPETAGLADHLRPVMLKLSRHLRREAQNAGVTAIEAQLLGIVLKRPGSWISELAELEQMSRPAMSVHVKRLEAAGWLTRRLGEGVVGVGEGGEAAAGEPESDRRRVRLTLTPAGHDALNAIRRSRNDWLEARLVRLTPPERAALTSALAPLTLLAEMKL